MFTARSGWFAKAFCRRRWCSISPGYLLPCHGIRTPDEAYLCLYAAHLARQPDGHWMVINDRTQGPSGTGYTLENRIAVSRTLRHDFESLHIERLGAVFHCAAGAAGVDGAPATPKIRAWFCSRRACEARRFLKMDTWRGIWATRWSKGAI